MFLEYLALVMLIVCLIMVFYAFLYVHELPYEAAKHRNHPQQEAIYVACWLSLFTLHAIWPLVWIWAVSAHKPLLPLEPRGEQPGYGQQPATVAQPAATQIDLSARLAQLEAQVAALQANSQPVANSQEA